MKELFKQWALPLVAVLTIAAFVCCSDDKESEENNIDPALFQGDWCLLDMAGGTATCLSFSAFKVVGTSYEHLTSTPTASDQMTGSWLFYSANNNLKTELSHSIDGVTTTNVYVVQQLTQYSMQLRDQRIGAVDVYYRISQNLEKSIGSEFELQLPAKAINCTSTNSVIATVDAKGHVKVQKAGIAFILAETEAGTMVVKIESPSRINAFMSEIASTIDQITTLHGEPDSSGETEDNKFILYNQSCFDVALNDIFYQYDEKTREVTLIYATYRKEAEWNVDVAEMKQRYQDAGDGFYGESSEWSKNQYVMSPSSDESGYGILYYNTNYFFKYGHF